jgi:putative SOS response-associated peptidase YedK
MCNLYVPPAYERLGKPNPRKLWGAYVAPLKPGPYLKPRDVLEVGQWGMIPPDCKTSKPTARNGMPIATNNARRETLATAMTYRGPWAAGQRCLIPAVTFDEPYYPGHDPKVKSIAWRFGRADGELWMLAGLWAEWTDPETGEVVPSYTMITQNCDSHPLLALMHRPEVDKTTKEVLPAAKQDKRAVTPIEKDRWDEWLHGTPEQANALIRLPAPEIFLHGAADPSKNIPLPGVARNTQLTASGDGLF